MTEYALRDIDGNELILNDAVVEQPTRGSLDLGSDSISFDNRIVENSSLPGSVKLGKTRVQARELVINFSRANSVEADFKTEENTLIEFLSRTVLLVDKTNDLSTSVAVSKYDADYEVGSRPLSSENAIRLEMLDPFWRALTADNVASAIALGTTDVAITNSGFLPAPPIMTFTTTVVVTQLQIYVNENKEGIQIDDALFGTVGFLTLIIDCDNGTIDLVGLDRTISILPGTGYFDLLVGAQTLKVVSTATCNLSLDFFKRFYI